MDNKWTILCFQSQMNGSEWIMTIAMVCHHSNETISAADQQFYEMICHPGCCSRTHLDFLCVILHFSSLFLLLLYVLCLSLACFSISICLPFSIQLRIFCFTICIAHNKCLIIESNFGFYLQNGLDFQQLI